MKILGKVLMWIFFVYMIFAIFATTYIYLPVHIVLTIISCPVLLNKLIKRIKIKHSIIARVVIIIILFFISSKMIDFSSKIYVKDTIKPEVLELLVQEYREYNVVDVISWKYVERGIEEYNEYYEVSVEIALKDDKGTQRVNKKYLAVYDIIEGECIEISEIKE